MDNNGYYKCVQYAQKLFLDLKYRTCLNCTKNGRAALHDISCRRAPLRPAL